MPSCKETRNEEDNDIGMIIHIYYAIRGEDDSLTKIYINPSTLNLNNHLFL